MKTYRIATCVMVALACGATFPGSAGGAVVLNQIGDVAAYDFGVSPGPTLSQVFPDFPDFDCTVLEDFTITGSELRISHVSALFRAQAGFITFQDIQGYYLNFFSIPDLAATSLTGDVASIVISPGAGASVTPVADSSGTYEYGLVSLNVDIPMPSAGNYWVGLSLKSSVTTDQFLLMHSGAVGVVTPGNANGRLANPGLGLGAGALSGLNRDYAYALTTAPEPGSVMLSIIAACGWLCRRRRTRDPDQAS